MAEESGKVTGVWVTAYTVLFTLPCLVFSGRSLAFLVQQLSPHLMLSKEAIRPVDVGCVDTREDYKRDLVSFKKQQSKHPRNGMYFSF